MEKTSKTKIERDEVVGIENVDKSIIQASYKKRPFRSRYIFKGTWRSRSSII